MHNHIRPMPRNAAILDELVMHLVYVAQSLLA
jgi:hypothetical protein